MNGRDRRARPPAPFGLGRLLEPLYTFEVQRRNRRFDAGAGVHRAPIPVICVGNLSVGGTGKTPFVMWLVDQLRKRGLSPGIAMRGYRAAPGQMSDEQAEYAMRLEGVPVAADPVRFNAVTALAAHGGANIAVLDDGFQHRSLARDLDIVLCDATRPVFDDRCLPAGWLREPASALARAGAVVWTRADLVGAHALEGLMHRTQSVAPDAVIAAAAHRWSGLAVQGQASLKPVEDLRSARVAIASGIGNPTALRSAVEAVGATVTGALFRPDHHAWDGRDVADLEHIVHGAEALITTDKDWVKLRALDLSRLGCPILRPRVELAITHGLDDLLACIDAVTHPRDAASSP